MTDFFHQLNIAFKTFTTNYSTTSKTFQEFSELISHGYVIRAEDIMLSY